MGRGWQIRLIVRNYVLAILVLALLVVASFATLRASLNAQARDVELSLLAARQSKLYVRLHAAAQEVVEASDRQDARALRIEALQMRLSTIIAELESENRRFVDTLSASKGLFGLLTPRLLNDLYFGQPNEVQDYVHAILTRAKAIAALDITLVQRDHEWASVKTALSDRMSLPGGLDAALDAITAAARTHAERIENVHVGITLITLLVLLAEAVFVFGPMMRRLRLDQKSVEDQARELDRLAHCDALTGALNRAGFHRELKRSVDLVPAAGGFAVILCDLDRFKAVNDGFGHHTGDKLLIEMTGRIRSTLRRSDIFARLGGDEFALIMPGIVDIETLQATVGRIRAVTAVPWRHDGIDLDVSSSVGGAICPLHSDDPNRLLAYADKALYAAKQQRPHVYVFDQDLRDQNDEELALLRDMGRAFSAREFEVFYQPKIRLADDATIGMEALVRWRHPERGLMAPARFLPAVTRGGRMVDLTLYVLDDIARDLSMWAEMRLGISSIAVNMPEAMLATNIGLESIRAVLARYRLPGSAIVIEITEDVLVSRAARAIQDAVQDISDLGVGVAFDDFGTGFASLIHLRDFRFDELKIDRSFVAEIGVNTMSEQIVRSIVSLARALEKGVVAEGVETEAQLEFLRNEGCAVAQGYLFARPMPARDFENWLAERETRRLRQIAERATAAPPPRVRVVQ